MSLVNYFVNINSKDRISPATTNSNEFSVQIQDIINLNSKRTVYLTAVYANIPPTWYNITTQNNSITVIENTDPLTVALSYVATIQPGNYNINDFMTALTAEMTAQSALFGYTKIYTATYNAAVGYMTITQTVAGHTFTFSFNAYNTDLAPFLGFGREWVNLTYVNPQIGAITSPDVVNFAESIPAIYIRSNMCRMQSGFDTSDSNTNMLGGPSDILAILPIENNGFSSIIYKNYEGIPDRRIKVNNVLNQNMTFKLTSDDPNFKIDLNGSDWTLTLIIQYVM